MTQFAASQGAMNAAELGKYVQVLLDRKLQASANRHAKRLMAFRVMVERAHDPNLFGVLVKAFPAADERTLELLVELTPKFNNPAQHGMLCDALGAESPVARKAAAKLLATVAVKASFDELVKRVAKASFGGRLDAMEALVPKLGHRSLPLLSAVVEHGKPREQAHALAWLAKKEVWERQREAAFQAATGAIDSADIRVLSRCVKALAIIGPEQKFFEQAGPMLVSTNADVVRTVLEAVAHFKSQRTIDLLRRKLHQGPNQVRLTVLEVLEEIGTDDVVPILVDALSSRHVLVRSTSAKMLQSLAKTGKADIARSILWLLKSKDPNVRRMAAEMANAVKDDDGKLARKLLTYLTDEDWWVRERVTDALASMWSSGLSRHLVSYLKDESDIVRRFAIGGLRRVKDPKTLGALVRTAMGDEDWWVRETAVETIAELKDPKAYPYLVNMLNKQPDMRLCVIEALSDMNAVEHAADVAEMLGEGDADVRYAAIRCLERLGDRAQGLWLKQCETDDDLRVRHAAKHLLAKWTLSRNMQGDEAVVVSGDDPMEKLLERVVESGADDLIVATGRVAYMKKMGQVYPITKEPLRVEQIERLVYEQLSLRQREALDAGKDVDFSYHSKLAQMRFRVNVFQQMCGLSAVFRTIKDEIADISGLGLPLAVRGLSNLRNGLVLVGGPTGAGKSTTLAALVNDMNKGSNRHIITIEDPIEVVHKSDNCLVNQREVGSHAPAFSTALRSVLREDPDVILIGEMRDLETISFAVTAAETGHLVFATVHTVSADKCVDRIINAFPAVQQPQVRGMLSETLRAVVCQHLLRKRDRSGRVLAVEVMLGNEAIKALIRKGKAFQIPSVIATHTDKGMQLMDHQLARLVKDKVVAYEEAYMRAVDKADFERRVGDREDEEPLYAPPEEDDRASSVPSDAPPRTSLPPATPPPHSMPRPKSASTQRDSKPDRDESLRAGSGKPTAESDKPRDSRVPLKSGIPRATTSGAYSHTVPPSSRRGGSGGGKGS